MLKKIIISLIIILMIITNISVFAYENPDEEMGIEELEKCYMEKKKMKNAKWPLQQKS